MHVMYLFTCLVVQMIFFAIKSYFIVTSLEKPGTLMIQRSSQAQNIILKLQMHIFHFEFGFPLLFFAKAKLMVMLSLQQVHPLGFSFMGFFQ